MVKQTAIFSSYNFIKYFPLTAERVIKTIEWSLVNLPVISKWKYTWILFVRQRWQFFIERALYNKGKGRVYDPLFTCKVTPGPVEKKEAIETAAGNFNLRFIYNGLNFSGSLKPGKSGETRMIEILIDDIVIKHIQVKHNSFNFKFKRRMVDLLPRRVNISIRQKEGEHLIFKGSKKAVLNIPHGNGSIFDKISDGFKLTKKGTISLTGKEIAERQRYYLNTYSRLKRFFEEEFDKPLFLMYGTLLGFYRDGDFIPGDDDFDCCYISEETDPVLVKNETKNIVIKLVQAGFTVGFNRKGRLFRIPVGDKSEGLYVDICPVWFDGPSLYTHPRTILPAGINDFYPVSKATFRDTEVYIPNSPEVFLSGYYGPGWKVPDPGYINDTTKISKKDMKYLKKAFIGPKEYIKMDNLLKRNNPKGSGRLISASLQDLYPLEEFVC